MGTFKVYKNKTGSLRFGVLSGTETADYQISGYKRYYSETKGVCTDGRPWATTEESGEKVVRTFTKSFRTVRIQESVKKVGDFSFAFFENAKIIFENASALESLGTMAFMQSGVSGRLKLGGLTEEVFPDAFHACGELQEVDLTGSAVTSIAPGAFQKCFSLERVKGAEKVKTIGEKAFLCCPVLEAVEDCEPDTVGNLAFHICGISSSDSTYDADVLKAIREVELPDIIHDVPNSADQGDYPDLKYCQYGKSQLYISEGGCAAVSLYHVYNMMHPENPFPNFREFWEATGESGGGSAFGLEDDEVFGKALKAMNLKRKEFPGHAMLSDQITNVLTWNELAKTEIVRALEAGHGIVAQISKNPEQMEFREPVTLLNGSYWEAGSKVYTNSHAIAIVGCEGGKLVVVDSSVTNGEGARTYKVAYEDLFMGPGTGARPQSLNDIMVIMKGEEI